jgi:hypothetical protein
MPSTPGSTSSVGRSVSSARQRFMRLRSSTTERSFGKMPPHTPEPAP